MVREPIRCDGGPCAIAGLMSVSPA